jgi:hypothetical protein
MILIAFWFALHPVHVTLMSIDYSSEDKVFNIFLKVYYDDFLTDYRTLKGSLVPPDLSIPDGSSGAMIVEYLEQRVNVRTGETDLTMELVDYSLEDNELKLNLICRIRKEARIVTVRNAILTDIYKDQANLVILNYGSFEEGVKLTPEKREYRFIVKK